MKKSDLWHLKEGIVNELSKTHSLLAAFLKNYEKRHERLEFKVLKLEDKVKKLKK